MLITDVLGVIFSLLSYEDKMVWRKVCKKFRTFPFQRLYTVTGGKTFVINESEEMRSYRNGGLNYLPAYFKYASFGGLAQQYRELYVVGFGIPEWDSSSKGARKLVTTTRDNAFSLQVNPSLPAVIQRKNYVIINSESPLGSDPERISEKLYYNFTVTYKEIRAFHLRQFPTEIIFQYLEELPMRGCICVFKTWY